MPTRLLVLLLAGSAIAGGVWWLREARLRERAEAARADEEARRGALIARLGAAVRIDPDERPSVADGTLVLVTGPLTAEGPAGSAAFGMTRAKAIAIAMRSSEFVTTTRTRTVREREPFRNPGMGPAPGYSSWITSPGFMSTRVVTETSEGWQALPTVYAHAPAARIGALPLSDELVSHLALYRQVESDAGGGEPRADERGERRVTYFELPAMDATLVAVWRDGRLDLWRDPESGLAAAPAAAGAVDLAALLPRP